MRESHKGVGAKEGMLVGKEVATNAGKGDCVGRLEGGNEDREGVKDGRLEG